jgi:hypothetical protein
MLAVLASLLLTVRDCPRARAALHVELLALRHQIHVLTWSRPLRPRLTRADRLFWIWLSRFWQGWQSALVIVKPETVIAWHRRSFRLFWRWKSHRRPGRQAVPLEIRRLIRPMSDANPLWGAADPRRTPEARHQHLSGDRHKVHGSLQPAAIADVAQVPDESPRSDAVAPACLTYSDSRFARLHVAAVVTPRCVEPFGWLRAPSRSMARRQAARCAAATARLRSSPPHSDSRERCAAAARTARFDR